MGGTAATGPGADSSPGSGTIASAAGGRPNREGASAAGGGNSESVVTPLAGFVEAKSEGGGRAGSGEEARSDETSKVGVPTPKSVITSVAGFEPALRPQPGGRTAIPAAFKYPAAVSRRTPVAPWIRRSVHPSRPKAITCCFFSSFKTLAISAEAIASRRSQCPGVGLPMAGFQVIIYGRFWVITEVTLSPGYAISDRRFAKSSMA